MSAAKVKMDRMINELKEEYQSNLKKKDEEIQTLKRIIAEQSQVCATQNYTLGTLLTMPSYNIIRLRLLAEMPRYCSWKRSANSWRRSANNGKHK